MYPTAQVSSTNANCMNSLVAKYMESNVPGDALFSQGKLIKSKAYKVLFTEDQVCNSIIYIKSGVARQSITTPEGQSITKSFLTKGQFTMYSAASFVKRRRGEVCFETLTDCEIIEWPVHIFEFHIGSTKWVEFVNALMMDLVVQQESREISLLRDSAAVRVRQFMQLNGDLFNQIPHYYIASYLRITPETLSRIRSVTKEPKHTPDPVSLLYP